MTKEDWIVCVGEGWRPILRGMFDALDAKCKSYRVAQIKEKFGTLRVYLDGPDPAHTIALTAEYISAYTCEYCGRPGSLRGGSWFKTLCDGCQKERKNANTP